MPRTKKGSLPTYRLHKPTGQAVVTIDGHDHYLGRFGSPDSHVLYERLVKAWRKRQEQSPASTVGEELPALVPEEPTINAICLAYIRYAKTYYRATADGERKEVGCIRDALKIVRRLYGRNLATEFGPKALKDVRHAMVTKDWSRGYVNHQIDRVRRMIRYATEEEMIPPGIHHGLLAVRGLRKGLPGVRETKKVRPVRPSVVKKTLKYLPPMIRAMVLFEFHTGCRPAEVCRLKPRRINRSGDVWVYELARHKTAHHGKKRRIFIGPRAQKVLLPWLKDLEPNDFVFSPARAERMRQADRRALRKTPLWPSHVAHQARKRKPIPKRPKRQRYDTASFRRAIKRACDLAFPPPERLGRILTENGKLESQAAWWKRLGEEERNEVRAWQRDRRWHPNQLRHTAATRIRKQHGIETARVILGHTTAFTTEIYAEVDREKAATVVAAMG